MSGALGPDALVDRFGRRHTYLRVSVTDRCNFRCFYCMPDGVPLKRHRDILGFEELHRLVALLLRMGIRRVRLTGGEPTVRRGLVELVRELAELPGLEELSMTTNGQRLAELAGPLARAGLRRVNVSLDSLAPERFRRITRFGRLERVLAGIDAALAAGLGPVKVNAVVVGGLNEEDVLPLVDWARRRPRELALRFIEYMPFDDPRFRAYRSVPAAEIRRRIAERYELEPWGRERGAGPAVYWREADSGLRIGFIAPLSVHFCESCNRLRLEADGWLRPCLARADGVDLRGPLRAGATDDELAELVRAAVLRKRDGHACALDGGIPFEGVMAGVGG